MMRQSLACLLAWILAFPANLLAATAGDTTPPQRLIVVFLTLDAAAARLTYRHKDTGTVTTSPVSSPATLEKLAKIHGGQKIILTCRAAGDGQVVVEDVKKKTNWRRRGIILGVIVLVMVPFMIGFEEGI